MEPGTTTPNGPTSTPGTDPSVVSRVVLWACVLVLIAVPARIIMYGYLPLDDALRHAAKAVSGKPWSEILVLGQPYSVDHNFGWELLLRWVHLGTQADAERLVDLSVLGLFVLFGCVPLIGLRRPEAWLGVLLLFAVAWPPLTTRLLIGRPLLVSSAVLLMLLCLGHRRDFAPPRWPMIAALSGLIAAAVFLHGVWYLWVLPVVAFGLARQYAWTRALAASWVVGTLVGAVLTGHPWDYLAEAVQTAWRATELHSTSRTLVSELQPASGGLLIFFVLGAMLVLRRLTGIEARALTADPAFWLAGLGWVLGFVARRFWEDWGLPALMVLAAGDVSRFLHERLTARSPRRLVVTACLAVALYGAVTSDTESRWTKSLTRQFLVADDPDLAGWLPEREGIFYAADPGFFYDTFFKNPTADWRYILGFEMTLMPAEDFRILYRILWNFGAAAAFQPWVEKMRAEDRLFVRGEAGNRPPIAGLEWHHTLGGMWSGRLPRADTTPASRNPAVPP